tara:strand:+ start:391 stop:576 length:186 start_codon:yes stop_codon:yes gene_type:complete
MASEFLKKNFKSLNNNKDEDEDKKIKGSISNAEMKFLSSVTPGAGILGTIKDMKKLLEEDK